MCLVLMSTGCGRVVRRFAGNAAGGIVDQVIEQPSSTVELLESELRWMEDNLYIKDDQLETALLALESARRDNAILRLELAEARGESGKSKSHTPAISDNLLDLSPPVVIQEGSVDSSQSQELPVPDATPVNSKQTQPYDEEILDLSPDDPYGSTAINPVAAPQSTLKSDTSQSTKASDQESVLGNGEGVELQAIPDPRFTPGAPVEIPKPDPFPDEPETGGDPSVEDPRSVMQIKLNRLTGGYNFDGKPGHEGLMVVIEPQNRFGTYTRASGELTIEVTDPSRSGVASRVGKWKFDSIDTRRFIKETRSVKGVEMQLPWPGAPPENRRLQLDVSYQLADGRTLTAEKKILVIPVTSALVAKANGGQTNWSPQRPATPTLQTQTKSPSVSHRQASSSWLPNR